ncbi:NACHT domain-containing protein [Microdochium trichocladiopsis]|uniref:NACHT domain-containing protein n=1 Tax=Microdochium trichocladiopsis TaxID=1682393 RepID=A0A9P9BJC9_9PEZI|nr:NACHT domain-containing protein [Microdochium trichocladiopsis]KAH7017970.1 NACHT domain-containing protein [Microdochium trichocladiopsis]
MAPSMLSPHLPAAAALTMPDDPSSSYFSRSVSASYSNHHEEEFSGSVIGSRQLSFGPPSTTRKVSTASVSNLSHLVHSIRQRSYDELGRAILSSTYDSLREWISEQRMSELPPEGSSYDKVLAWAQLFADRLHSFEYAVQEIAGDSYLAAQLSYGYCSLLLDLGQQNARALMVSFGFFYNMSIPLVDLLQRTELFGASREIRDHVIMALSDLVTLVASVATHFHGLINNLTKTSVSVNVYSTFAGQIKAFLGRCEMTSELMWTHQLQKERIDGSKFASIKHVRRWLAPEDHVLEHLADSASHLAHEREELTCLYIGTHLTRFLRGPQKIMSLHGAPGSGKSVLASVIVDYLQRPIAGIKYNTLFVAIDSRIPVEAMQRGIARCLLNQLFQRCIGDVNLLKVLADAHERSLKSTTDEAYNDILWKALARAVSIATSSLPQLVLVVDGLDECKGGEGALYQRLRSICTTKGVSPIKLIVTGAQAHQDTHAVHLDEDLIFDDIMKVIDDYFGGWKLYVSMSEADRDALVDRIVTASKGSFVWAKQASRLLRREESAEAVSAALDKIEKSTVFDFVRNTLSAPEVTEQARMLLTWMVTSERPLSVGELAILATVNVEKKTLDSGVKINVNGILNPAWSLLHQQDGLVHFRHATFRQATIEYLATAKGAIKDRHGDFAVRLLVYISSTVTEEHKCSLTILGSQTVHQLTTRSHLLDFAVCYWPTHLRKSLAYHQATENGDSNAARLVAKFLPQNMTVWLLQAALWEHRPTPVLLTLYSMLSTICRELFTTKSVVTLQVLIFLGNVYRQVDFTPDAITCFHEAATISHALLTTNSAITVHLSKVFLELTSALLTSARTDVMLHREQVLRILVECYTVQYGESSEYVVSTYQMLIDHYRLLKDEKKAEAILVKIRIITGKSDIPTADDKHMDGSLEVHLRGRKGHPHGSDVGIILSLDEEDCDESLDFHGGVHWEFEVLLLRAQEYLEQGRIELAEHTYVEIWEHVNREFRISHSSIWEERKLRTVVCYARFLMTQETRVEYARSILSIAYAEFKSTTVVITEETSSWYLEISAMMKTMGLVSESLTIMKRVSSFFQSTRKTETSVYKELQITIESTSEEIFKSISSTSSTTTTISEEMIEEMVLEQSKSITTIEQTTFTATFSLVRIYIAEHRWHDSSRLLKQILRGIWPSLFAANIQDVIAPAKHVEHCVDMATRLAECYRHRRRKAKEGDIRVRVYRAMRSCRKVDSKLRGQATHALVHFLKCAEQTEQLIVTHQEILDDYTCHYGSGHALVVKQLWILAELTRPRPIYIEYYQKIIRALHKDNDKGIIVCHDAFEPFIIVATELYSKGQFTEALSYFKVIFSTFLHDFKCYSKFSDSVFARSVFDKYTYCLRTVRADFSLVHSVCVEYQAQCKAIFGMSASITVHATLHLARLCMESKRYEVLAIELFEALLHIECAEIDHEEICGYLESIYESQTDVLTSTTTSTTTTVTLSSEQVQRAIKTLRKRVTTIRETHGWAHEESLCKLSELIKFYSTSTTTTKEESTIRIETILTELREATVHILSEETSSVRLIAAASTIASSYVSSELVHKAIEIKHELYRQIIMKNAKQVASCGFNLTHRNREVLVFLAEFEYTLCRHSKTITVTDILAQLTTQYLYFTEFRALISAKTYDFCSLVAATSRLYGHLQSCERFDAADEVFADFAKCFTSHAAKTVKFAKGSHSTIFLQSVLQYFSKHRSSNFLRSVCIGAVRDVQHLLQEGKYEGAIDLATAVFTYVSTQQPDCQERDVARTVLIMGLTLAEGTGASHGDHHHHHHHSHADKEHSPSPKPRLTNALPPGASAILVTKYLPVKANAATMAQLLSASTPITRFSLRILLKKTNMSLIPLPQLDRLISIIGSQRDYTTLSDLLTSLWTSSRDNCAAAVAGDQKRASAWPRHITSALSQRVILSRYLVGDTPGAVRLAEDVVYNSRRVHGSQHGRTLDMGRFLASMYTTVALRYLQQSKDGKIAGMPARYLKKAAAVHEGVLRSFSEVGFVDMEGPAMSWDHSNADSRSSASGVAGIQIAAAEEPFIFSSNVDGTCGGHFMPTGDRVRLHFRLLKLAVQRLGAWPKDYKEYERLNADVFREFSDSMRGVDGVEKWDFTKFGKGKAEGSDDILDIEGFREWSLLSGDNIHVSN